MTKIGFKDQVRIQLKYFDDSIIGEIPNDSNTWQITGLKAIRDATGLGGTIKITDMKVICDEGSVTADNLSLSLESNTIAVFEGSWATGSALTDVGTVRIQRSGTIYSEVTTTLFTKDNQTSLIINWRSTISGDWNTGAYQGLEAIAYYLTTGANFNEVDLFSIQDLNNSWCYSSLSFTAVGNTVSLWEQYGDWYGGACTISPNTFDIFKLGAGIYYHSDISTMLIIPPNIDLRLKWRSTFSAG